MINNHYNTNSSTIVFISSSCLILFEHVCTFEIEYFTVVFQNTVRHSDEDK